MEHRQPLKLLPIILLITAAVAFAFNVQKHFFLGDDAFISFRYAKHLVLGNGLVWNEGYRVEGYTNFLWVILMAFGMVLGIEPEFFAPFLSILAGSLLMVAYLAWLVKRHGVLAISVWVPVFILCLNRSFTGWVTGGLETMFHAALIFAGVVCVIRAHEEQEKTPWAAALFFAAATLTRPDSIVFAFTAGCAILFDSIFGKRPLKTVVFWTLLYFAPVLLHVAWRYSYYGFPLPNTFYAKVAGLWLDQSLNYFGLFHRFYQFGWFLPFVLLGAFSKFRCEARYFLFLTSVYLTYIVYVGGDRFEFRFLVVVFPFVYWLLVEGVQFVGRLLSALPKGPMLEKGFVGLSLLALFGANYYGSTTTVPKPERHGIALLKTIEKYATSRTEQGKFLRRLIDEGLYPADLTLALGGAGAVPYYSMLPVLDRRGLNNVEIAHMPITERGRVAHEHDAPIEYLVEHEIAVFDVMNRMYHKDLRKMNSRKFYHDGHRVRVRALKSPYGFVVFATFVTDEKLRELFPKMELILPDWEQELLDKEAAQTSNDSRASS